VSLPAAFSAALGFSSWDIGSGNTCEDTLGEMAAYRAKNERHPADQQVPERSDHPNDSAWNRKMAIVGTKSFKKIDFPLT
jgi:hypothetical protein